MSTLSRIAEIPAMTISVRSSEGKIIRVATAQSWTARCRDDEISGSAGRLSPFAVTGDVGGTLVLRSGHHPSPS